MFVKIIVVLILLTLVLGTGTMLLIGGEIFTAISDAMAG